MSNENQTQPCLELLQQKLWKDKLCSESQGKQQHLRQFIDAVILAGNSKDMKSVLKELGQVCMGWLYQFNTRVLLWRGDSLLLICPAR